MTLFTDYHFLNNISCFSWILFQQNGDILASSPCPGPPERTRADAWSLLAGVHFLHHLWKLDHRDTLPFPQIRIINRNKRIICRIQEHVQYQEPFCNITLDRDWDIIRQIIDTQLNTPNLQPTWRHMHEFLADQSKADICQMPTLRQRLYDTKDIAKNSSRPYYIRHNTPRFSHQADVWSIIRTTPYMDVTMPHTANQSHSPTCSITWGRNKIGMIARQQKYIGNDFGVQFDNILMGRRTI